MNSYEIISLVISSGAVLISIIALVKSQATGVASIEISINERITATKEKVMDCSTILAPLIAKRKHGKLSPEEIEILDIQEKQFNTSIENNLNAYENACAKYLDGRIDRKRFKKEFYSEIKELVERDSYKKYFDPTTSKFKAILKTYKIWCDLEQ